MGVYNWRCKWCDMLEGPAPHTQEVEALHKALHTIAESIHGHGTHENRDALNKYREAK